MYQVFVLTIGTEISREAVDSLKAILLELAFGSLRKA
jgi:hypothetical protein